MSLHNLMRRVAATSSSAGRLVGLIETEMAKPLLVNPSMVDQYARSLLTMGADGSWDGEFTANEGDNVSRRMSTSVGVTIYRDLKAAVLDISGPLVNRDVNAGPCSASPVSYAAIRSEIAVAVSDPRIDTVIARIDSGGGMASQMVDLNEFIRDTIANNPQMRFIASIDDDACSAAFGIACAFPERYISRTGVAGSVGVVVKHTDVSKAEANIGVKHTYIYAGANKILGNSSEPLTPDAKEMIEKRVKMHYDLFVKSVSDSLGITEEAVRATEANVYQGQDAVDVGFATGLKTFTEILLSLEDGTMLPEATATTATTPVATATTSAPAATAAPVAETPVIPEAPTAEAEPTAEVVAEAAAALVATQAAEELVAAEASKRVAAITAICDMGKVSADKTAAFIASDMTASVIAGLVTANTSADYGLQTTVPPVTEESAEQTTAKIAKSWAEAMA